MKMNLDLTGETVDTSAHAGLQRALAAYEEALNTSDIEAVLKAFTPDGVFMAPNRPSAVGLEAVRAAYGDVFQAIAFDTELTVEEMVQVAPDWAFARTRSNGFVTVHAIKQRVPDANHELFILRKADDAEWKIARYAFASTSPPPQ